MAHQSDANPFEILVRAVTDYALYMLDPTGIVTSWNAGAERAKGYTAQEIVGQHFSVFYTEQDRAAGLPQRALETAAKEGRYEAEGWRLRKDGTRFWANAIVDPIRNEAGTLLGFAKITRDISERRALELARERLWQAQNLEMVGQLTGGVAHDFNNLLTAVLGSLSLVSQMTLDARARRLLQTAERAAARGAKLTSQLLAFARRQTLKPKCSNLNELINVFDLLLREAVGEQVQLDVRLSAGLWLVDVDQGQFQSAILNLVANARDAMRKSSGTITVETCNADLDAEKAAALGDIEPGRYVVVSVRDTGVGMRDEERRRAIEPFYTTKTGGEGSGLGLSQVYGFVRQSKGQIEIESRVGQGTAVRLYLPRLDGAASDAPAEGKESASGTILVVEDDADVLEVALESLKTLGYRVYAAQSAPEALTILQRDVPIDVLFTDVVMPKGMTGVELAREARALRPTLRVLLSSGYAQEALSGRDTIPGDLEFIAKPYPLPLLAERLRAMMSVAQR